MVAELNQIYYADYQKEYLYHFAKPYFNENLTMFFENQPITKIVMSTKADKVGVCSWKLKQKLRWNLGKPQLPEHITEEVINSEYDVLPFTRNSVHHQMLGAAEMWHPGFKEKIKKILDFLGINCPSEVKIPINQNHFMAKTDIYQDYVRTYLLPAMEAMKNVNEIRELATADSQYSRLARQDGASAEYLQQRIGFPFYPMAPFLLERLFSVYVHNKRINVTFL